MLEREYKYYESIKSNLLKDHLGEYVVIKDNEIVGIYKSLEEALREGSKRYEIGTFLIQKITEKEEIQQFTSRVYV